MRARRPRTETSSDYCDHKIDTGSAMNLRFYTDPEMGYPHIYDHGVEEHEVEDVIMEADENRAGRGNSRIAIGQTRGGRYLRVVYVRDPEPAERGRYLNFSPSPQPSP